MNCMRSRMHSFWPAKAWQGSMQFQSPLQQHDVTQWWAPYHGMALYASIFTFLVFPLWCWLTMMHGTDTMPYASCMSLHNHSCSMLDFSLSLYCIYSVTPRRWTSDLWLGQSLGWPGQCLSHVLQCMSQSFSLSKASLVPCPLSFFLICILYVSE